MPLPRSFRRPSILARRKEEGRKEGPVSKRGSILSLRKRRTWRKMGRKEGGVRRYMDGWIERDVLSTSKVPYGFYSYTDMM